MTEVSVDWLSKAVNSLLASDNKIFNPDPNIRIGITHQNAPISSLVFTLISGSIFPQLIKETEFSDFWLTMSLLFVVSLKVLANHSFRLVQMNVLLLSRSTIAVWKTNSTKRNRVGTG